jgi:HD domain
MVGPGLRHAVHSANADKPRLSTTPMERDVSGSEKPDFSDALAVGRELDLNLPDSHAVRDAYAQAQAESPPWLFNHVVRSWFYGAKLAQHRALTPDAELVAVAVLLHDLGLARGGAPDRRFEIVGADAGRAFALSHDMGERRAETIWDSIALHTTASIAQHKGTDVACCQSGIACDYGGVGYQQLSDDDKKVILSAYPRLQMKQMLTTCLCGIASNHPNTTRDNFIADFGLKYVPGYTRVSSVDFLHQAPFLE